MSAFVTLALGIILSLAAAGLVVYFYFVTGQAVVATSAPPMPFEKMLAHQALNARIGREMPKVVPVEPDEPNLAAGAKVYREHCAVCHGLPEQKETPITAGMYLHPPRLLEGKASRKRVAEFALALKKTA